MYGKAHMFQKKLIKHTANEWLKHAWFQLFNFQESQEIKKI